MKSLKQLTEEGRIEFPAIKKSYKTFSENYNHRENFEDYGHIMQVEPDNIEFKFDEEMSLCPTKELTHVVLECQRDVRHDNDNGFNPFFHVRMGGARYKIYANPQPYTNSPVSKDGITHRVEIFLSKIPNLLRTD